LLGGIGGTRRAGGGLASYLLFEKPFTRALIDLGYRDTMARADDVMSFLGLKFAAEMPSSTTSRS
ncbi:hypothetical protein ABTF49_19165, partial [Acinetobacter baumannii]